MPKRRPEINLTLLAFAALIVAIAAICVAVILTE